jgi:hypothetical protein
MHLANSLRLHNIKEQLSTYNKQNLPLRSASCFGSLFHNECKWFRQYTVYN